MADVERDVERDVELSVLRGFVTSREAETWTRNIDVTTEGGSLLRRLMDGDFEGVLLSPGVCALLRPGGGGEGGGDIEDHLEKRFLLYLDQGSDTDQPSRELLLMGVAVSCLQLFVQSNWTGPPVSPRVTEQLCSQTEVLEEAVLSCLLLDGEAVYSLVATPLLLLLARVILTRLSSRMDHLQLLSWWTLRYVSLHQQVLEVCSQQLCTLAISCMDKVERSSAFSQQRNLEVQFHLECVYTCLTYYEYQPAKEHLRKAQQLSGLDIGLTGALGKRTRFQQKFLAQLVLDVKRGKDQQETREDETTPTPTPQELLPKDCRLSDDTVLDELSLVDPDEFQLPKLSAEEQAVILGVCIDYQKNNPVHKLTEEELLAFTSCVLSQPKFWAVEVAALSLRTKLEKGRSRCVERAMMQTQAIVDHFEDQRCPVTERLKVFYCAQAPPHWAVQKQLAVLLTDLGCVSSALLMFEKLQMWEDVVTCYEKLGQHGKAEEILRRELEKEETPSLYCLLGDVLRDHQYYDRAWALAAQSGRGSARAMRSKALLHLHNKEFQQSIDCFERSLQVNSMQLGVWFSLGCAYLAVGGYEGAVKSFLRCVGMEPDNAEAWNNLSTAYIRLHRKTKAFLALQEALRWNYEHWQIWENFLVVSTDIGEFSEAINAYHRLMDLRENYKDLQVLQVLVQAVVGDVVDGQGQPAAALTSKMKELLGRASSRHSGDAEVWQQYARLYGAGHAANPEDDDKVLLFLSKAHRCEVRAGGWEKDRPRFLEVIQRALLLGEVTLSVSQRKSSPAERLQILSSTRLSLTSLITKAKQTHSDVVTGGLHAELQEGVAKLELVVSELRQSAVPSEQTQ